MQEKFIECYPSLFSKEIPSCKVAEGEELTVLLDSLQQGTARQGWG